MFHYDDLPKIDFSEELSKEDAKWDFLFLHLLGFDHVGHNFGLNHPVMAFKLQQYNKIVSEIVKLMDNETILIMTSDHG